MGTPQSTPEKDELNLASLVAQTSKPAINTQPSVQKPLSPQP